VGIDRQAERKSVVDILGVVGVLSKEALAAAFTS